MILPKTWGQKIPTFFLFSHDSNPRDPIRGFKTRNVPPFQGYPFIGGAPCGPMLVRKTAPPVFKGQASNGICHCYLDSHGATHLGEPRGFSKTHGSEFPRRTIVLKTKSPFLIVLKTKEEKPWISCTNGLGPKQDGKKSPRLRFFIEAQVLHLRPFQFSGQGTLRPFRNGSWLKSARRYPSPLGFFFQCQQGD